MVVKKHPPGKGKNRDQYNGRSIRVSASGTLIGASSTAVAAGDTTLILTVSGGIWLPADAGFDDQRQGILDGITGDDDFATVLAATAVTDVARTSNTVVTITFPSSAYGPSAEEAVSVAVPASAFYLTDTPRITTRTPSNTPLSIVPPTPGDEGPLYPSTFAEFSSGAAWSNDANMGADDGAVATVAFGGGDISSTIMRYRDFGFAIPDGATITGIIVEIERHRTDGGGGLVDNIVQLVQDGVQGGTNHADTDNAWPTSAAVATYGADDDTWGRTWTAAQINAAGLVGFGVNFRIRDASDLDTANVDYVRMTVHYTT